MYLSKVMVNWKWAINAYDLHRALWQLFPDRSEDKRDFQFRVEQFQKGVGALVLLQSKHEPQASDVAMVLACKALQMQFTEGSLVRFKLRANPIKTIKDQHGRLDKKGEIKRCRVPLLSAEEQVNWLQRKLDGVAALQSVDVLKEPMLHFHKKSEDRRGKIKTVCFEGVLSIKDVDEFHKVLSNGIGAAKSMGCGLLSLAPVV